MATIIGVMPGFQLQGQTDQPKSLGERARSDENLTQILDELRTIRAILEKAVGQNGATKETPNAKTITLNLDQRIRVIGTESAPVTLVEFSDYQCPFCAEFHNTVLPLIKDRLIGTGRVRFIHLHLPLPMHANAVAAAMAAECANDAGMFWKMHDRLATSPDKLGPDDLKQGLAEITGAVSGSEAVRCLEQNKYRDLIMSEVRLANSLDIVATPNFIVGRTSKGILTGRLIPGFIPYEQLERLVAELEARDSEGPR